MITRFGNLLYWLGCAAASLSGAFGVYFLTQTPPTPADRILPLFFAFAAMVFWLIGRAARYVLAGR